MLITGARHPVLGKYKVWISRDKTIYSQDRDY